MICPRYMFTFVYEYIDGDWSFCCIYADTLEEAKSRFSKVPTRLYFIKTIDRKDNRHCAWEEGYEPEVRVFDKKGELK